MWIFVGGGWLNSSYLWNNNIKNIYIWDEKVRPAWWQPWSNTLLYLPLKSDTADHSWNNVRNTNVLTTSWTITFDSSVANIPVAYFNWSSWIYTVPKYTTVHSICTVLVWVRYNSHSNMPAIIRTWWTCLYVQNSWVTWEAFYWTTSAGSYVNSSLLADNTWQLLWITSDWSISYCYFNWQQVWTINKAPTAIEANDNRPCVWNNVWDSQNRRLTWYVSEIIWETRQRTAQEVSDYYNQTKWNYWL